MRLYLYIIAGITSALLGWNLGRFILDDVGWLKAFPYLVLYPCIAISLAVGIVLTEIFISNPTRTKLNWRIARLPVLISIGLGLCSGLIAGGISQILSNPNINTLDPLLRSISWVLIGVSTGLAEGITWRWRSIEAGDPKRFKRRLITSVIGGFCASLAAAILFELFRNLIGGQLPDSLRPLEHPIGLTIFGVLLGFVFSFSASPSYLVALRAGAGFEYRGKYTMMPNSSNAAPTINKHNNGVLSFVSDSESEQIEEGLSIQLPPTGQIKIGGADTTDIQLPGLPPHIANLEIMPRETTFKPNSKYFDYIEINGFKLDSARSLKLKHNSVITFHSLDNNAEQKYYRFVYYNRFLDPQA
jgi:hypothetical protein